MSKIILLTGATDGIGFETAKLLASQGHSLLIHGRNPDKLTATAAALSALPGGAQIESYAANLSRLEDVAAMAAAVQTKHDHIDVLINNAGVLKTSAPITPDGFDARFVVNTISPYLLTQRLAPALGAAGRVINVSSAAQAPVDLEALAGRKRFADDMTAYAQSKLAITMWSRHMALTHPGGPAVIAVNPGSLLGSKMVKEAFNTAGGDLSIGAEILLRAALSEEFAAASGYYFDNDSGCFARPHQDALDDYKCAAVVQTIDSVLTAKAL